MGKFSFFSYLCNNAVISLKLGGPFSQNGLNQPITAKYEKDSPASNTINISYVERCNLTMRQRNHRVERKSQGFSKLPAFHKAQMRISIAYYNFCLHHSSLKRYEGTKPLHFTPAMEAGITDHPWTMLELLKIRIATLNGA